jgi:hypothetical protein
MPLLQREPDGTTARIFKEAAEKVRQSCEARG